MNNKENQTVGADRIAAEQKPKAAPDAHCKPNFMAPFVMKLKHHSDKITAHLYNKLSPEIREALAKHPDAGLDQGPLQLALRKEIEKILNKENIYDAERFAGITLRPETLEQMERNPTGYDLFCLNYDLLEDAFPEAFPKIEVPPWVEKIHDNDIYILNPFYRLRNTETDHVLARGVQGVSCEQLHRAAAIVVALCDGIRTVAEIAEITRPLVKGVANDAKLIKVAKENVKMVIYLMTQTRSERDGLGKGQPRIIGFPETVLISKQEYEHAFKGKKYQSVSYRARDFLPESVAATVTANASRPIFENHHYAAPASLIWHFTSDCSTDCRYCYLGRRQVKPMPKERTLSLLQEAADIGVVDIVIGGGDVILYPHLEDVLKAFVKHKFVPGMISTKSFISKDKAKMLADLASVLICIQYSIDSTVPEIADFLVASPKFCDRVFRSIDNLLEAGLRVEAKSVITPYNILTIPRLYRDLKQRGVSVIRLAAYCRTGFHHSDDLYNHAESFRWLEGQLGQLRKEFPEDAIHVQNGSPQLEIATVDERLKAWPKRSNCTAGREAMMICADGMVIPCEQMPETDEYFCGDVSKQSILDVWNGERMRQLTYGMLREKFKGTTCYDCDELPTCSEKGNCIRDQAALYGNIYQPPVNCPKFTGKFIRVA